MVKKSPEIQERLIDLISGGMWQIEACRKVGITDRTIRRWRAADEQFGQDIEDAVKTGFMQMLHSAHSKLNKARTRDDILRADKLIIHLEWMVSKLVPGFEDKRKVEATVRQVSVSWLDDDDEELPEAMDPARRDDIVH